MTLSSGMTPDPLRWRGIDRVMAVVGISGGQFFSIVWVVAVLGVLGLFWATGTVDRSLSLEHVYGFTRECGCGEIVRLSAR
jgi:hypothetical protein